MKFLKIFLIIVILACINPVVQSQTILIDTTFTTDGEIYPFSQNDTAYGVRMSGDIVLNSDTSLVRVIFSDKNYNEYMVYEAYPLISSKYSFSVSNVYDETYCLDEVIPYSIRIEIINASSLWIRSLFQVRNVQTRNKIDLLPKELLMIIKLIQ